MRGSRAGVAAGAPTVWHTTSELGRLSQWLREQAVEEAVMESTAQYWKPVWYELEPYLHLQLAQAFSNRAPRGRKHDFKDAERLVHFRQDRALPRADSTCYILSQCRPRKNTSSA